MILNKNRLNKALAISLTLVLLLSCSGDDWQKIIGKGKSVEMHFTLKPVVMKSSAFSRANVSDEQGTALAVSMGGQFFDKTPDTKGSTGVDESVVHEVCVFQFNGTESTSKLIKSEYYDALASMELITALTESSSMQTIYVVANVGDIRSKYTTNTTLQEFQSSFYEMGTESSVTTGSDLPMIGSYTGTAMPGLYSVSLTRLVAKVTFSCTVNLQNTGDAFAIQSVRLYSTAAVAQLGTPTGVYPGNTSVDEDKYVDYAAESSYTSGSVVTWYVPENLKGTVGSIGTEEDKTKASAPAYSTYIEVEGIYTFSNGRVEYATYRFYPGNNLTTDFNLNRNTSYAISMTIKGLNESDARISFPKNLSLDDYGQAATANCYIVNQAAQTYQFNATVMGNGKATPAATISGTDNGTAFTQEAPAIVPTTLAPASAFVIWETGNKGDVIEDGSLRLINNTYLLFKTANNNINGNALIGVKDANGTLLWSWHIWKTDYAPNVYDANTYDTYRTRTIDTSTYPGYNSIPSRSFKMMKYNLGTTATAANYTTSGVPGELGLYYQWGRKDPFVGATDWTTTTSYGSVRITTTNASGYEWFDGSAADAEAKLPSDVASDASGSISYAIKHPTHFIKSEETINDWIHAVNRSEQRDNLWGNPNLSDKTPNEETGSKSIYDPCPPGWMVTRADGYTEFTVTGINASATNDFLVSGSYDKGWNFYNDGTTSGTTFYWPSVGCRTLSNAVLVGIGTIGYYWTSSSYNSNDRHAMVLNFTEERVQPMNLDGIRSGGAPIRCVQEE